ncbi:MAG: adhesin [Chloroflexota bacterium]|nr:adhesin [Chloroflexota bacterium]
MVHVTDMALDRLEIVRDENALPPEQGIALVPQAAGELGFVAAAPQPDDEVIERDGKPILVVPASFSAAFDNLVVDYADTPEMQGFTISQVE